MKNVQEKRNVKMYLIIILLFAVLIAGWLLCKNVILDVRARIVRYAQRHSAIVLGETLDFDWDYAIPYTSMDQPLQADSTGIVFYKDGEIVKQVMYPLYQTGYQGVHMVFVDKGEFFPDSQFSIEWDTSGGSRILYLHVQ